MLIRVVAFDFTNTLARFRVAPAQVYQQLLRTRLHAPTLLVSPTTFLAALHAQPRNFGADVGMSYHEWWRSVVQHCVDAASLDAAARRLWTRDRDAIVAELLHFFETANGYRVIDGVEAALAELKAAGDLRLAVVSNNDARLPRILRALHLDHFFDAVVVSGNERSVAKPDREMFLAALDRVGLARDRPAQLLHVGDDARKDFDGAFMAGAHAVLVDAATDEQTAQQGAEQLRATRRTVVARIGQVPSIVQLLNSV